jgi:periplasmic divalent cation tolerance protein
MDGKREEAGPEICVIFSTVPPAQSREIARGLLMKHLAACVNILPVRSLYWWKGDCCDEEEHLLVIKTRKDMSGEVIRALKAMHPYEVPEMIVLPVTGGHPPYIDWVYQETERP